MVILQRAFYILQSLVCTLRMDLRRANSGKPLLAYARFSSLKYFQIENNKSLHNIQEVATIAPLVCIKTS